MSVVFYGQRPYGKVDGQGDEYAVTRFFHLQFMPIIPVASYWVMNGNMAVPTRWNGRSILAAYARTWGVIGLVVFAIGALREPGALVVAAALATLIAISWRWRRRRGDDAMLRGQLGVLAFGAACSPELHTDERAAALRGALEARVRELGLTRPPEDVARFGSTNHDEIVCAYGLLSLAARDGQRQAHASIRDLLRLEITTAATTDGVYREGPAGASADRAALVAGIAEAAAAHTAARDAAWPRVVPRPSLFHKMLWGGIGYQLLVVALLASFALVGFVATASAIDAPGVTDATPAMLARVTPPHGVVRVHCDDLDLAITGSLSGDVYLCRVGAKLLPIVSRDAVAGHTAEGRLHTRDATRDWDHMLASTPDDVRTFEVYLSTGTMGVPGGLATGLGMLLGSLGLFTWWRIARRRRARRAAQASTS